MLAGHLAAGFAAKRITPRISLGALVLASLVPDLLWCAFLIAGIEHVRFKGGTTVMSSLDAYDIAYSHSLLTNAVWAGVFAATYFLRRRYPRGAWMLFVAVLSHWLLDVGATIRICRWRRECRSISDCDFGIPSPQPCSSKVCFGWSL